MENDYFVFEYDNENKGNNMSSISSDVIPFDAELENITEFVQKGLQLYSISEYYFVENKINVYEIRKKCKSSENVLFCRRSNLPLGYFCSSPIFDIVTGKTKRGRIHKKECGSKYEIKYYFNNDRLVFVDYSDSSEIFLFYDDPQRTVYEFMLNDNRLYELTVCKYDAENRITERTAFSLRETSADSINKKSLLYADNKPIIIRDISKNKDYLFNIKEEKYIYGSDRIIEAVNTDFHSFIPGGTCDKYEFRYNGDYYGDYDFINCSTNSRSAHKADIKRKFFEFIRPPAYSDYVK